MRKSSEVLMAVTTYRQIGYIGITSDGIDGTSIYQDLDHLLTRGFVKAVPVYVQIEATTNFDKLPPEFDGILEHDGFGSVVQDDNFDWDT